MNGCMERIYNGLIKENPTFVLMLGMCPTLAVTTSATNGVGMGLSTTVVLVLSNMLISMLRKVIPDSVRMPAFIVVVASFVTIVQFLLQGFVPSLYASLGIYIPLIVVNCIILGRAESYASKNPVLLSIFDGIGMGLGFTVGLTAIGLVRFPAPSPCGCGCREVRLCPGNDLYPCPRGISGACRPYGTPEQGKEQCREEGQKGKRGIRMRRGLCFLRRMLRQGVPYRE